MQSFVRSLYSQYMGPHINYSAFTIDDFVWDDHFRDWVLHPDSDSDLFWKDWIKSHPIRQSDIIAAKEIVLSLKATNIQITDGDKRIVINNVLSAIHSEVDSLDLPAQGIKRFNVRRFSYISIAASIILIIGLAFWFNIITINKNPITYKDLVTTANQDLIEKMNNTGKPVIINLSDGSTIILEKNARISMVQSFENLPERKIYLSGEATFEVARDVKKPFIVYAGGLVTKVLGTKFTIRSYDNEKATTVEVKSGIVAVYSFIDKSEDKDQNKKLNSLILTRNQKANYDGKDQTLMATIVDTPVIATEKQINYNFEETPLIEVFNRIRSGYGIEVIYDEKILAARTLTGNLEGQDLYNKIEIICKVTNSHYEIIDGKIVIYYHSD